MFVTVVLMSICVHAQDTTSTESATSPTETTTADVTTASAAVTHAPTETYTSVTLANGVMFEIIKHGTGESAPSTATLRLHYALFLTNGQKLDDSRNAELPVPLNLKEGNGDFIPGVETGVTGMKLHEIRRLFVPANQAYGAEGKGKVPPNANLIFEMELVDIR